jgi:hypothetical protein
MGKQITKQPTNVHTAMVQANHADEIGRHGVAQQVRNQNLERTASRTLQPRR